MPCTCRFRTIRDPVYNTDSLLHSTGAGHPRRYPRIRANRNRPYRRVRTGPYCGDPECKYKPRHTSFSSSLSSTLRRPVTITRSETAHSAFAASRPRGDRRALTESQREASLYEHARRTGELGAWRRPVRVSERYLPSTAASGGFRAQEGSKQAGTEDAEQEEGKEEEGKDGTDGKHDFRVCQCKLCHHRLMGKVFTLDG